MQRTPDTTSGTRMSRHSVPRLDTFDSYMRRYTVHVEPCQAHDTTDRHDTEFLTQFALSHAKS